MEKAVKVGEMVLLNHNLRIDSAIAFEKLTLNAMREYLKRHPKPNPDAGVFIGKNAFQRDVLTPFGTKMGLPVRDYQWKGRGFSLDEFLYHLWFKGYIIYAPPRIVNILELTFCDKYFASPPLRKEDTVHLQRIDGVPGVQSGRAQPPASLPPFPIFLRDIAQPARKVPRLEGTPPLDDRREITIDDASSEEDDVDGGGTEDKYFARDILERLLRAIHFPWSEEPPQREEPPRRVEPPPEKVARTASTPQMDLLSGIDVLCPYEGCGVMVKIPEIVMHAFTNHRQSDQGVMCPICPYTSDSGGMEDEHNLLLHLHDVHSKYIPESIENELDAYYESCLEDMLNATLTNQEAALRTIEEQTPKKPVESPAVRPSPEPPSDIPPPLCVEGGIVYENYKIREGDKITECVICCEDIAPGQIASRLACFCVFHRPCFEEWYVKNPSCPLHPPMSKE